MRGRFYRFAKSFRDLGYFEDLVVHIGCDALLAFPSQRLIEVRVLSLTGVINFAPAPVAAINMKKKFELLFQVQIL